MQQLLLMFCVLFLYCTIPLKAQNGQTKPTTTKTATARGGVIDRHNIPKIVMSGFIRRFPNHVRDAKWKKEGANYVAIFGENDKKGSITLNSKGEILKSRGPMDKDDLPETIQCYSSDNMKGYRIVSVVKTMDSNESLTYEILYKSFKDEKKMTFDRKGNPINNK